MNQPLNREQRSQIDQICDDFERQLREGARPELERFLERWEGPGEAELFQHLLGLEVDYRRRAAEPLELSDYTARFPDKRRTIEDALSITRAPSGVVPPTLHQRRAAAGTTETPSTVVHQGQFVPGSLVAQRYRIVALLGRGGMGEVYRADDLKLGQPVALKFVAASLSDNSQLLELFHNEVRLSRQITHPHVCRVFDIGEFAGQHYLTMEYIDGETLSHLIRRIGPLPPEKCKSLARQMGLALAAAHESNVLHRDLKPGNVMIDGRGRAKITDFGLARLAHGAGERELHAGTPAYMAPEQYHRNQTSPQSDLYALGLVLYEMCTGQSPRTGRTSSQLAPQIDATPPDPVDVVRLLDRRLSDLIMWCLHSDPGRRPPSARAWVAALPGGDGLSSAVAAGETPSPEMVAACPGGGLSRRAAVGVFAAALAAILTATALSGLLWRRLGLEKSPPALVDAARRTLRELGCDAPPADEAWGLAVDRDALHRRTAEGLDWEAGGDSAAPPVHLWYRRSDRSMTPHRPDWTGESFLAVGEHEPPLGPGDIRLRLAPDGRLLSLDSVIDAAPPAAAADGLGGDAIPWAAAWRAAGLEEAWSAAQPAPPTAPPRGFADRRAAWQTEWRRTPLRVEAAAAGSQLVLWRAAAPWDGELASARTLTRGRPLRTALMLLWIPALLAASLFLALRNQRRGRGDLSGATRLATFLFCLSMLVHLLRDSHVAGPAELDLILSELAGSLLLAAVVWLAYLALEPQVRRTWPRTLVGSTRVLAGRRRDPVVGRDLLWGALLGAAVANLKLLIALLPSWIGSPADSFPAFINLNAALGGRLALGEALSNVGLAILYSLFNQLLFLALLFALFKKQAAAIAAYVVFFTLLVGGQFTPLWLGGLLTALEMTATAVLFLRCGLLAVVAMHFVRLMLKWPVTWDLGAWHADVGLLALALTVGLASCGLYNCWRCQRT